MTWLSFFIGVLVGWIIEWFIDLFFWRRAYQACREENEALQARLDEAERRIATLRVKGWEPGAEPWRGRSAPVAMAEAASQPADGDVEDVGGAGPAAAVRQAELPAAGPPVPDDLKLLEGIGPKIAQLLQDHGIVTFGQLANTSIDRLEAILRGAGPRYQLADPGTWPEQARLAADGAWEELQALQDRLSGGRRTGHQAR
jgi:predicted flap endonuclease-1-like 5' DNA nuclease